MAWCARCNAVCVHAIGNRGRSGTYAMGSLKVDFEAFRRVPVSIKLNSCGTLGVPSGGGRGCRRTIDLRVITKTETYEHCPPRLENLEYALSREVDTRGPTLTIELEVYPSSRKFIYACPALQVK